MKRYRFDGQGSPLLSTQGQIIQLPLSDALVAAPNFQYSYAAGTGLSLQLFSLTTEKYLVTEPGFRLRILADGSLNLMVNIGLDGPTSTAIFACTAAEMATAGVVLTTSRPHFIFIEPVSYGITRSDGYVFRVWVDGISLPLLHTDIGGTGWPRSDGASIGGTLTASYSDFCVFEFFKSFAPHPTAQQLQVIANGGRGVDLQRLHFMGGKLLYLIRYADRYYDAANQWFVPLFAAPGYFSAVPNANGLLYSSAFKSEYGDTSRLYFDGLNDFVNIEDPALKILATGLDNFTYVLEVIPNKPLVLPAETGNSGLATFSNNNEPTVIAGNHQLLNLYELTPWLGIGTNGVSFGYTGLEQFGNIVITTLLSYATPFSATQSTRVAIRVTDRTPQLWINGVLKYQGLRTAAAYSPGSANGSWPMRLMLTLGEAARGFNGSLAGTFGGWVKNFRVWNYARTDADLASTALPLGNEPGLLVFWTMGRTDAATGTAQPMSTTLADRANMRPGKLTNFVLSPAVAAYKLRIGRAIR